MQRRWTAGIAIVIAILSGCARGEVVTKGTPPADPGSARAPDLAGLASFANPVDSVPRLADLTSIGGRPVLVDERTVFPADRAVTPGSTPCFAAAHLQPDGRTARTLWLACDGTIVTNMYEVRGRAVALEGGILIPLADDVDIHCSGRRTLDDLEDASFGWAFRLGFGPATTTATVTSIRCVQRA